jgi:chorismate mutase
MPANWARQTIVVAFAIMGIGMAHAQSVVDQFQPLVEISARRLIVADQVALAKWDSGAAVEDVPREAKVISDAVRDGEAKGLDRAQVSSFFKAQIEANKIVQYNLLADWHRSGRAPAHAPINLVTTVRPELDQMQIALIDELARTAAIRSSATCHADLAKAVDKYLSTHKRADESLLCSRAQSSFSCYLRAINAYHEGHFRLALQYSRPIGSESNGRQEQWTVRQGIGPLAIAVAD